MSVPTVAVVGAGFGGLALAIRLKAAGVRTVILEKREKPGGRAYVYHDSGFTFDAGPTVITAPNALEDLFTLAGRRMGDYVDMLPVDPYYRLSWENGFALDYNGDFDKVAAKIREKCPVDVDGYRRFLGFSQEVFEVGYQRLAAITMLRTRMLHSRSLGIYKSGSA